MSKVDRAEFEALAKKVDRGREIIKRRDNLFEFTCWLSATDIYEIEFTNERSLVYKVDSKGDSIGIGKEALDAIKEAVLEAANKEIARLEQELADL